MACTGGYKDGGANIEPLYPASGWDVTDTTLSFRWKHQVVEEDGSGRVFALQVDDDEDFSFS